MLAWTVVIEPSWPVFIACSMSSAAPSRTSPTTMRSGRIRSEFLTRSRIATWPRPSMFAGRDSSRSTCSWCSWSSAASSMVTIRSSSGMKHESTLSVVVLPEPVPPEITMLRRPRTQALRKSRTGGENVPKADQVRVGERVRRELSDGQHRAVERHRRDHGVDPGAVGQAGVDQRAGLVDAPADAADDLVDDAAQVRLVAEARRRPGRSCRALDEDARGPLTMISVISGSRSSGSSGPWPRISSETSCAMRVRSACESGVCSASMVACRVWRTWPLELGRGQVAGRRAAARAGRSAPGARAP